MHVQNSDAGLQKRGLFLKVAAYAFLVSMFFRNLSNTVVDLDLWHQMALVREGIRLGYFPLKDQFAYTPTIFPSVHHEWGSGAMGNARWKGVRLRDLLHKAGLKPDALEVVVNGADKGAIDQTPDFVKSIPVWKALDENTLIAFGMNGEPLPHWNGFPARLVVPGWSALLLAAMDLPLWARDQRHRCHRGAC